MIDLCLSTLVESGDVDGFLRDAWGSGPHLCRSALRDRTSELLSLESFELLLATLPRAHEGWLHLARGGLKPVPRQMVDEDGMLDLRALRMAFTEGETLYLTKAERLSPGLMRACRAVHRDLLAHEIQLRRSVNAHVFATPPDARGFPPHQDEHGSFIIQLEGVKHWTVYEPAPGRADDAPRTGEVSPSALEGTRAHHFTLEAGDVLYMPEWWPHEAHTSSASSLHVTLRVFPLRWRDLIVELCGHHPGLARAVPREGSDAGVLVGLLRDQLLTEAFLEPLPALVAELRRRHAVPKTALPSDGLRQATSLARIDADTLLRRDPSEPCTVSSTGDEACVSFPGGVIRGPAIVREVFQFVAEAKTLRTRDLPPIAAGDYDRVAIVRRMVRDGLLRIVESDR